MVTCCNMYGTCLNHFMFVMLFCKFFDQSLILRQCKKCLVTLILSGNENIKLKRLQRCQGEKILTIAICY